MTGLRGCLKSPVLLRNGAASVAAPGPLGRPQETPLRLPVYRERWRVLMRAITKSAMIADAVTQAPHESPC